MIYFCSKEFSKTKDYLVFGCTLHLNSYDSYNYNEKIFIYVQNSFAIFSITFINNYINRFHEKKNVSVLIQL